MVWLRLPALPNNIVDFPLMNYVEKRCKILRFVAKDNPEKKLNCKTKQIIGFLPNVFRLFASPNDTLSTTKL